MKQQRHFIKKQIIEFNLSSKERAFELQNELSRIYRHKVIALIDNVFSEFGSPEIVYRINTLEIDLGNIDINNLCQEFIDKFIEKIKQKLQEEITLSTSIIAVNTEQNINLIKGNDEQLTGNRSAIERQFESNQNVPPIKVKISHSEGLRENLTNNGKPFSQCSLFPVKSSLVDGVDSVDAIPSEVSYNSTTITEKADKISSQLEIFSYFIQTGMLPWWSEKLSKQELEECCDRLITNLPNKIKYILEKSFQDANQFQRIIYQFSDAILLKIVRLFTTDLDQFIKDYNRETKVIFKHLEETKNISQAKLRLEKWQGIFFRLTSDNTNKRVKLLLSELQQLSLNQQTSHKHTQKINQINNQLKILLNEIQEPEATHINQILQIVKTLKHNIPQETNSEQIRLLNPIATFSESDEIYIYNAGLILLWPFLDRFLIKIGLVEEKLFINKISAERATLLLQYLVDTSTESPEYIFPLNKILCSIDLLEPIDTHLEITPAEQLECENLLSAVIQNWSIMKNTSIEGFRKAFLQRNGILRVGDGGWLLQVERETYDVVLDRIPWSIRVVKLPWMDNILYVEW